MNLLGGVKTIAVVTLLGVVAGVFFWRPWEGEPTKVLCLFGLDAQASTRVMNDSYRSWLPDSMTSCAQEPRGDISVFPVTSETLTDKNTGVSTRLADLEYSGNDDNDDELAEKEITRFVKDEVERSIFGAPAQKKGGTDVIGSAQVAASIVEQERPASCRLVLFTDGINNHGGLTFGDIPLGPEDIAHVIDRLDETGQIPELPCDVAMYGVGIGHGTYRMGAERLAAIQRFYEAFWARAGARLVAYQRAP